MLALYITHLILAYLITRYLCKKAGIRFAEKTIVVIAFKTSVISILFLALLLLITIMLFRFPVGLLEGGILLLALSFISFTVVFFLVNKKLIRKKMRLVE